MNLIISIFLNFQGLCENNVLWFQIEQHNALFHFGQVSYDMRMNQFGDFTEWEFEALMFGRNPSYATRRGRGLYSFSALTFTPASVDLRLRGMVTPVKNQGYCASGAIFSAIGALEGALYKSTG